jgi:selenoprotein W-related protein
MDPKTSNSAKRRSRVGTPAKKATKPALDIEYCPGCRWLMRAAWMAQELLTTFEQELAGITLRPSETKGAFEVRLGGETIFSRKAEGGFLEIKEIKQRVRDRIAPGKSLGHSDKPA